MKKIGVVLIISLLLFSCQKNNETSNEYNKTQPEAEIEKSTQVNNNVAISDKDTVTEIDTPLLKETVVEKLPKIKPIDFTKVKSEADLWDAYNITKQNINRYKDIWNFDSLLIALNDAAQLAQKLNRPDIASWQYNNIGFYSINEFKKRTDYTSRTKDLEIMPYGDEKVLLVQETRDIFNSELDLLKSARESLYDAMELSNQAPDKNREKIIDSNLEFINSIIEYLN